MEETFYKPQIKTNRSEENEIMIISKTLIDVVKL